MSQICGKCSHANPPEAIYCYFDGALLEGHRGNGGPVNAGTQPFPSQFVFPSGQACRNFDQLAMACQQNWQQAIDLLKQGFLAAFFGGLGRADLAVAAREAASNPDQDRGLDQLLAKLPTQVLERPQLAVEPKQVNLGVVPLGTDRQFELVLRNQGMRLLYGSIVSNSKWLTLGESPGNAQKIFQCRGETTVLVNIRGQHLRAGTKPLEGVLEIESNGGNQTIKVRLEVPIKPFPDGVLAGALTPRQVAEKAKAQPKEAAVQFEKGAVAEWFKANGWTYPVQGPSASGLGAVQQFFEALGLVKAPKVQIDKDSLSLQGSVGQTLQATLEVKTEEKRPVYAHATCDQAWVNVSKTKLSGRFATITVLIPSVPDEPGEILNARIHVQANGNQRFHVPLTLTVAGVRRPAGVAAQPGSAPVLAVPALLEKEEPILAVPAEPMPAGVSGAPPLPVPILEGKPAETNAFAFQVGEAPIVPGQPAGSILGVSHLEPKAQRQSLPWWVHLAPVGLLALILLMALILDLIFAPARPTFGYADGVPVDEKNPRITIHHDYWFEKGKPPAKSDIMSTLRFGIETTQPAAGGEKKKLTYGLRGHTNSTVLLIDKKEKVFGLGGQKGKWIAAPKKEKYRVTAFWLFDDPKIQVVQKVELIPGEPVYEGGEYKRLLDTCLVRYEITNKGTQPHKVGLRFLLDTLIGQNDGVPFTVAGMPDLVDKCKDFSKPGEVPDFIQALEEPDLKNPGTVALLNLKVGGDLEPPGRVSLTRWPGPANLSVYEVRVEPMDEEGRQKAPADSAAVLYWEDKDLAVGATRKIGFSYGLGSVATGSTGQLGITVGGALSVGGELTVVGLVGNPQPHQTLRLEMQPDKGLALLETTPAQQLVPPAQKIGVSIRPSPVSWRLRATEAGQYKLRVISSTGEAQERTITIKKSGIFN